MPCGREHEVFGQIAPKPRPCAISAHHPTEPVYRERQVWGMKSRSRDQGRTAVVGFESGPLLTIRALRLLGQVLRPAPCLIETFGAFPRAGRHYPAWLRSNQRPPLSQRSRSCHPGRAARRISIHSGVTPGRVASSTRASPFVWVTQGITAGASPSSGWQANSRRMPLGS